MTALRELIETWRERAETLRRHGAEQAAKTAEMLADELESALRAEADDVLTLEQAAQESGFSAAHLARLIREGKIGNAGRRHGPRIRRAELPRKPRGILIAEGGFDDLARVRRQMARAVAHAETGASDGTTQ